MCARRTALRNVVRSLGALDCTLVSIPRYRVIKGRYERTLYEIFDGDVGELLHLLNDELLLIDFAHLPYFSVTSSTPIGRG